MAQQEDEADFLNKVQQFSPEKEDHFKTEKSRSVKICLLSYKCCFIMCFCFLTCVQLLSTFFSQYGDSAGSIIQMLRNVLNASRDTQ